MGTKRQRQKRNKVRRSDSATSRARDVVELPTGYMARHGRFIEMRTMASPEEHAEFRAALLSGEDELLDARTIKRERLLEILHEADPVDLVGRASLTYLVHDPNTYREWEDDRSPAHLEYLALQAMASSLDRAPTVDPVRQTELTFEALEIVRALFRDTSMLLVMGAVKADDDRPGDPMNEYQLKTRLSALGVRGSGYPEHLERVIHGCLDHFEHECRSLLGFTASEALVLIDALGELLQRRVDPLREESAAGRQLTLRELKRARRRKNRSDDRFPQWLLELPPKQAAAQVSLLGFAFMFADSRSLATIRAAQLSEVARVSESAAEHFLAAFCCSPDEFVEDHHAFPYGGHPLTATPVLRVPDGYLVPVPHTILEAIRPRMEDLIAADPKLWERYAEHRGEYLEEESRQLLRLALPGASAWGGIKWRSSGTTSDLDGLVSVDDLSLHVQCKAGRVTTAARRGAPDRMREELKELIAEAAAQHHTLAEEKDREGAAALGFSLEQQRALDALLQFEVIVTLDEVTVWATQTHELKRLDLLPQDRHVPWVLSILDLMAVVDLLQGAELVHYLIRRQRLERDGRIEAHDELDWVGHYLSEGLFFDRYFEGDDAPDVFRLLSYTEPIDSWYFSRAGMRTVETPKPSQDLSPELASLVRRLETDRPPHWILAAMALLEGDQQSRDLWAKAVINIGRRLATDGWSNATQVFNGRLGVTLYVDHRASWPRIGQAAAEYARKKATELGEDNWVLIGEGRRMTCRSWNLVATS